MSIIRNSEPISEVELSLDDQEMVYTINNELSTTGHQPESPSTPDQQCSICLHELVNKCYSDSCLHLFCFECLRRWSNTESTCPICRKVFIQIYHTFTEQGIHETYNVPEDTHSRSLLLDMSNVVYRMTIQISERLLMNSVQITHFDDNSGASNSNPNESYVFNSVCRRIIASRRRVYTENMWAEPLSDSSGHFTEFSPTFFRNNERQRLRIVSFIIRDLIALRELTRRNGHAGINLSNSTYNLRYFLVEAISIVEIRGSHMFDFLWPSLNAYTTHFCHELYNFANSPYDIIEYNRRVQYSVRPSSVTADHHLRSSPSILPLISPGPIFNETTGSANEEDQISNRNETIVHSFDVETIPYNPTETPSSSSMAQPSTSTGIRDSLDRQNNRYNLRSRKLVSPTVNESSSIPVHVSRIAPCVGKRRPNLDSSPDEEPTTDSQTQASINSRDVNNKKKRKTKNL